MILAAAGLSPINLNAAPCGAQHLLSGFQNILLRPVVSDKTNPRGIGIVSRKSEKEFSISPSKAINGLIGVAYYEQASSRRISKESDHFVLSPIHVLEFIHKKMDCYRLAHGFASEGFSFSNLTGRNRRSSRSHAEAVRK